MQRVVVCTSYTTDSKHPFLPSELLLFRADLAKGLPEVCAGPAGPGSGGLETKGLEPILLGARTGEQHENNKNYNIYVQYIHSPRSNPCFQLCCLC